MSTPEPMTADDDAGSTAPRSSLSILDNLALRRKEVLEAAVLDLPVPRWTDPEVFVRYRPLPDKFIRSKLAANERASKKDRPRVEFENNLDLLIQACEGVFARLDGDVTHEYSLRRGDPNGPLTKFDPDLAENLGLDPSLAKAREVVRELFIADGDAMAHSKELVEWSGYQDIEADEAISGE